MIKMLAKCVLFMSVLVTLVLAKDEPFSIGLGVLSPSYSQTVGKDGEGVKVNYEQKDGGAFSFSIGDEGRGVSYYHHLGEHAGKALAGAATPQVEKAQPAPHSYHGASGVHQPQPIPYASGASSHGHHPAPVAHYAPPAPVAHHAPPAPVVHHAGPAQHSFSQGLPKAEGGYVSAAHHNPAHAGPAAIPPVHAFAFSTALGAHPAPAAGVAPAGHGAQAGPQAYNGVPQVTFYNSIGGHAFQTSHQVDGAGRGFANIGVPVQGAHAGAPVAAHGYAGVANGYAGAAPYRAHPQALQAPAYQAAPFNVHAVQGQGGYVHGGRDHGGHSHEDLNGRYQG